MDDAPLFAARELPADWWRRAPDELLGLLGSSAEGLGAPEAQRRLPLYGPNRLQRAGRRRLIVELGRRLGSPLVLLLIAAGAVSVASGDSTSAWIIGAIVLLSVAIDRFQEQRAETTASR